MPNPTTPGEFIELLYAAHYHKRVRDAVTGEMLIFDQNAENVLATFDSAQDLSEINPVEGN